MSKIPKISGNSMIKYLIKKGFFVTSRKEKSCHIKEK